ncbi:MAG: nucleoside/nucleotide kinase family protein, partial [Candidatus Eremiobacteraeota bacterium]|nr:nucleoside/nucleotide kinase family protein [Candidatus Eremiobacteraeota bacterium]
MLDDPRNPSIPEMSVEESFAQLDSLRAGAQRYILGLAGAPGSGKSTLAERLHARAPDRSAIVPMDGFHLANAELRRLGIGDRKGAEDTFDSAGYVA